MMSIKINLSVHETMKFLILTCALCVVPFTIWGAQVYKWVDKDGNVHFSDHPQKEKAEIVDLPTFRTDPVLEQRRKEREDKREQEKAADDLKALDEKDAQRQEEQRKKNCTTARERVEQLQTVRRLFRIDESGERHDLSDEERTTALVKAREDVKQWCE
jgi:hypothetical protein